MHTKFTIRQFYLYMCTIGLNQVLVYNIICTVHDDKYIRGAITSHLSARFFVKLFIAKDCLKHSVYDIILKFPLYQRVVGMVDFSYPAAFCVSRVQARGVIESPRLLSQPSGYVSDSSGHWMRYPDLVYVGRDFCCLIAQNSLESVHRDLGVPKLTCRMKL